MHTLENTPLPNRLAAMLVASFFTHRDMPMETVMNMSPAIEKDIARILDWGLDLLVNDKSGPVKIGLTLAGMVNPMDWDSPLGKVMAKRLLVDCIDGTVTTFDTIEFLKERPDILASWREASDCAGDCQNPDCPLHPRHYDNSVPDAFANLDLPSID